MITPRETFRKSDSARGWLDIVDSNQFHVAANAALNEMAIRNSSPQDMATAASWQYRMEGAKQFLAILMGLTEPVAKVTEKPAINLDHKVK